ncbi:MAG: methylmalonyl Co-A mutase-associated GTPase MeaB [Chloroflexi bacterium]|nr:methylmalonyl Co-A mutase-associated GTPase MeaB [Chloroflexota bacterium]
MASDSPAARDAAEPDRGPSVEALAAGIRAGDRAMLGRAITLVESSLPAHRAQAQRLLAELASAPGDAIRLGVSGVPGVGKSSFIEALGTRLTAAGRRVAVLAVDPSSRRSGGSILGDKTRMPRLAVDPAAFIRPSPSGGALGGVAEKTRESIRLCEAAGYDLVIVETVGVGQSETLVAGMVDCFLVLMLPGAGDELQGIKRGILELADLIVVNKADGRGLEAALRARAELASALQLLQPPHPGWRPPVLTCSALTGEGLDAVWAAVERFRDHLRASGAWEAQRRRQRLAWTWALVESGLREALHSRPAVVAIRAEVEAAVAEGRLSPAAGAARILAAFGRQQDGDAD